MRARQVQPRLFLGLKTLVLPALLPAARPTGFLAAAVFITTERTVAELCPHPDLYVRRPATTPTEPVVSPIPAVVRPVAFLALTRPAPVTPPRPRRKVCHVGAIVTTTERVVSSTVRLVVHVVPPMFGQTGRAWRLRQPRLRPLSGADSAPVPVVCPQALA